jgi:NAD-dependent protein deacetylase/lipoamidase
MSYPPFQSIVVLTGAGVSAESGIQTFRAADGLWENHRVEDVASPEGYEKDPELVQRFYNARREQLLAESTQPNGAHAALAKLESEFDGQFLLVTQNIDDLHERAGSNNLIHMHGELLKMRCVATDQTYDIRSQLTVDSVCLCCNQPGRLRPHIVWFGEMPIAMDSIFQALSNCDLFVAIGTSGNVYPAAGFVQQAAMSGARTIEINLEPSAVESDFDTHLYGRAGQQVPMFVEQVLAAKK